MQLGDAERFLAEVDSDHARPAPGQRFRENAAAAPDVDHALALQSAARPLDPGKAKRIDPVERTEHRALGIPPVMRERPELGELARVDVGVATGCG